MTTTQMSEISRVGSRPWVAYIGPFKFPWGEAASRRVAGVAKSMLASDRDVVVISGAERGGARLVSVKDGGASLWVVGAPDVSFGAGRVARQVGQHVTAARHALEWLSAQSIAPSHIVVYGGGVSYALRALRWARKNDVAILADVVEWYSPRQFHGGMASPSFVSSHLALSIVYPRFDGIIAISENIGNRYNSMRHIVVPPTVDVRSQAQFNCSGGDGALGDRGLTLCYAGSPGRKDLLGTILAGFEIARSRTRYGGELRLRVAGPERKEVVALFGRCLPTGVETVGRVPQSKINRFFRSADFSVLLRPDATYSRAGFPTKFVESLASATPVISNITSDLDKYLRDGVNGIVINGIEAGDVALAIERAMELRVSDLQNFGQAAWETALASFDVNVHVSNIDKLLSGTSN